ERGVDAAGHGYQDRLRSHLRLRLGEVGGAGRADHTPASARTRSTTCAIRSIASSIASAVVVRPRERRSGVACSLSRPIAVSTWLGSTAPLWQAEPLEAATPSRSSDIRRTSRSTPGIERFSMLGSRGAFPPFT